MLQKMPILFGTRLYYQLVYLTQGTQSTLADHEFSADCYLFTLLSSCGLPMPWLVFLSFIFNYESKQTLSFLILQSH